MLGFVVLPQVLTEEEMQQDIDPVGRILPGKIRYTSFPYKCGFSSKCVSGI